MTLNEINALILDDVKTVVQDRVFSKKDPLPQYDKETDGEYEVWYNTQFTQAELDAELLVYKQELIDTETERLRRKDIEDRFNNLQDMRRVFHKINPDIPNPALWLRALLNQDDHADAESKISALEADESAWLSSTKKKVDDFIVERNDEYNKAGVTRDLIIEAMWEKLMENRPEKADALQVIREDVKVRVPKPK